MNNDYPVLRFMKTSFLIKVFIIYMDPKKILRIIEIIRLFQRRPYCDLNSHNLHKLPREIHLKKCIYIKKALNRPKKQ